MKRKNKGRKEGEEGEEEKEEEARHSINGQQQPASMIPISLTREFCKILK